MDKFTEIHAFLTVVAEGSFSAAARKLGRTPSAVSKMVARTEQRLGVRLFDRIGGVIRLTQEGRAFRGRAQRVADAMLEAENGVSPDPASIGGVLRVHTSLTFAKYQLAPLLPALFERYPGLHIDFVIGTDRLDFLTHEIDVAIHSGNPPELSLVGKPLFTRRWMIAASPDYLQTHGTPTRPDDLLQHCCLGFTVRTQWNTWTFLENGQLRELAMAQGRVGADQGELLRTLALQGLGIVRLAQFHIGDDVGRGRLVELLRDFQPPVHDTMYVLYPKGRSLAPRVRAFLSFLDEHFREPRSQPSLSPIGAVGGF